MIVLVVDDEPMLRRAHERMLRIRHGYTVHLAANGVEALCLIDGGLKPDAIISDLEMSSMGGDVLCVELRRRKIETPVLLTSGSDALERIAKLVGATDFVMKGGPLVEKILAFLRKIEDSKATAKKSDST